MSRSDVERDIVATLGQVPDFVAAMPDDTPKREWLEWKHFQMEDTALTAREKHLVGLGVAAAIHCPYCCGAPGRPRRHRLGGASAPAFR